MGIYTYLSDETASWKIKKKQTKNNKRSNTLKSDSGPQLRRSPK